MAEVISHWAQMTAAAAARVASQTDRYVANS